MPTYRHEAMATWFELRFEGGDPAYLAQASEAAWRKLEALEAKLSRYREDSEISALSRLGPGECLQVSPETFGCLSLACECAALTGGAFDPGLGDAVDRSRGTEARTPVLSRGSLRLDPLDRSVCAEGGGLRLDLGAIGKGYALDCLGELLAEWEPGPTLLIGGGSSLLALGEPSEPWEIGLTSTRSLLLTRGAVGCSGLSIKGEHILDPRTGLPTPGPARAWALAATAGLADALSTAAMLLPEEDLEALSQARPDLAFLIQAQADKETTRHFGRALAVSHAFKG